MSSRAIELLLIASLAGVSSLRNDPFVGKWKVNASKSRLNDEMKIEVAGANKYILTFEPGAVDTIVPDGTDQRALSGTTLSMTVKGPGSWRVVRKIKNRTLLKAEWRLSEDGNTLIDDYTQYENDAPKLTVHYVYERTAGTSGLAGTWDSANAQMDADIELQITPYKDNGLTFVTHGLSMNENVTFDGKPNTVGGLGATSGVVTVGRRVTEHSLEITQQVRGKVREIQQVELSPDLETLTMTVQLVGQSKPTAIFVFDRQ